MECRAVCQLYKIPFVSSLFIIAFIFAGCSSKSIVNSKLSITPAEQRRLSHATDRNSNNQLYESNLSDVLHPDKKLLLQEANLQNSEKFTSNYKILVKWYENGLSKHNLLQLSNNCNMLVGRFSEKFPLTESSLPCVGWWLEQKTNERNILKKQNALAQVKEKRVSLALRERLKWPKYQNLNFTSAMYNIDALDFSETSQLAKKATVNAKNCKYKNAYAALIFKLEDFLPSNKVYQNIENIYQNAVSCHVNDESMVERLNLRMGVLSLIHGKYQLAKNVLKKNQLLSSPQDGSRSLFWLGAIEQKKAQKSANSYWEKLIRENPFGFFAIIANDKMSRDPMNVFVSDDTISIQNRVPGGWTEDNIQAFMFDLFYANKSIQALKNLSRKVANQTGALNKDLYLFWSVNHSLVKNDRASIGTLAKYFEIQKEPKISLGLLNLNFPTRYADEIFNTPGTVDPLLVLALIRQESAFDANALSNADARGLMQLLPGTARLFEKSIRANKLYDPKTNIRLGMMYLDKLFARYDGRTEFVLAAYNAGPLRVDAWSQRVSNTTPLLFMEYMPFRETRNYVSTIMRNYYWYKRLIDEQQNAPFAKRYFEKNREVLWKPSQMVAILDADE